MQRVLTTATLVGLLIATAAAFAITERLKLVKSPIYGTLIAPRVSPTCGCARGKAGIVVKLRRSDFATLLILDSRLRPVRTLAAERVPRGRNVFAWDGRTDALARVPDGIYRVQIHLVNQHRTILFPNRIEVDTKPPEVRDASASRLQFSPDGDNLADGIAIQYRLSERAHALVYLAGRRIIRSRASRPVGAVPWSGRIDGHVLKPGSYTLSVGAVDLAGNVTPVAERARVRVEIRYIELAARRIEAARGARFAVGVSTDAARYSWRLGARAGFAAGPLLRLRAPRAAGRYTLTVGYLGHRARAAVIVR